MEEILDFEQRDNLYQFLIEEFGFTKIKEKYDRENFGNFSIVLSSDTFLINYVNDRSFLTIEIASKLEPSNWYDLSFIRDLIYNPEHVNDKDNEVDNRKRIDELNAFLKKDFNNIASFFDKDNYPNTKKHLDQLLKEQFKRNFK